MGGTLARYSREGVETHLITATRGERGRNGDSRDTPPEQLAALREAELMAAARELGIAEVRFLDYPDAALDQLNPRHAAAKIAAHIDRIRPHVVLTFGPEGAYGHPDHIAISQFTTAAVVVAAHRVSKLYYLAWTKPKWDAYQAALKALRATVDGVERQATPWPDWAVTTVIDTSDDWPAVWRAVSCHRSQMSIYRNLEGLSVDHHRALWGTQEFYRAFSLVNGGRALETGLFEGVSA
jgi:LmbE family N-acetylglucosaminyl deacetylase